MKANFEKINNYALDYMVEGGAKDYMVSATPAPTVVNGKNMYEEGTEVTLKASSNDILTFTNWNDGETGAERKIKMNVDQSYTCLLYTSVGQVFIFRKLVSLCCLVLS